MNRFRNTSRVAYANDFHADEVAFDSKKLLFLAVAALLVYSDLNVSPHAVGHCGAYTSAK